MTLKDRDLAQDQGCLSVSRTEGTQERRESVLTLEEQVQRPRGRASSFQETKIRLGVELEEMRLQGHRE